MCWQFSVAQSSPLIPPTMSASHYLAQAQEVLVHASGVAQQFGQHPIYATALHCLSATGLFRGGACTVASFSCRPSLCVFVSAGHVSQSIESLNIPQHLETLFPFVNELAAQAKPHFDQATKVTHTHTHKGHNGIHSKQRCAHAHTHTHRYVRDTSTISVASVCSSCAACAVLFVARWCCRTSLPSSIWLSPTLADRALT